MTSPVFVGAPVDGARPVTVRSWPRDAAGRVLFKGPGTTEAHRRSLHPSWCWEIVPA